MVIVMLELCGTGVSVTKVNTNVKLGLHVAEGVYDNILQINEEIRFQHPFRCMQEVMLSVEYR